MLKADTKAGHAAALLTILIWGTTFISTKVLLRSFTPFEILFVRFMVGFLALCIVSPHPLRGTDKKQEITFLLAGMCGVCLYYLLENFALTRTSASNVGVIISVAPFFTALCSPLFIKEENKLSVPFFIGFLTAILGICLISWEDARLSFHPQGDFLALAAAIVWAGYSILTRKIAAFGYGTVQTTKRIFAYGILFMMPGVCSFDFSRGIDRFTEPVNLCNFIFLGVGASALCFVTWNWAVSTLGAVKTSIYIYMVPVITLTASALILKESVTPKTAAGIILTLAGLFLSEGRFLSENGHFSFFKRKCLKNKDMEE